MKVYKHALYVGTYNSNGCEVWEYNTAGIWTQKVGQGAAGTPTGPGFGNPANRTAESLHVYDSRLFAGTENLNGCEVHSFDGLAWRQDVGGGGAANPDPGFGNANNGVVRCMATRNDRLYAGTSNGTDGCEVWSFQSYTTWYLAEGATAGGFETWVLVQNPHSVPVDIDMKFQTVAGEVQGPVETIPASTRRTYLANDWVPASFDVSTRVESTAGGPIICERAVYWRPDPVAIRYLVTGSIGFCP
ncbi:MAG: hypothetical protein PHP28_13385 [Actinomycetota bacterium]|nr:hypothetical protein [Actinomycetota bacterium]MDD5668243.1 hypothetical protein [Actinomycetota bacterium]